MQENSGSNAGASNAPPGLTRRRRFIRVTRPNVVVRTTVAGTTATVNIASHTTNNRSNPSANNEPSRYEISIPNLRPVPLPPNEQIPTHPVSAPYRLDRTVSSSRADVPVRIPLNDDTTDDGTNNNNNNPNLECVICFDTLRNPVSCGQPGCTARFCSHCLRQALATQPQKRCPACRSPAVVPTRDEALLREMEKIFIDCVYCGEHHLPLACVHTHEQNTCPRIHVRCRLAQYGCTWSGPRGENHRDTCPLEPIAHTFLEHYRQEQIRHQQTLQTLQDQVLVTQQQMILKPRNPIHVVMFFCTLMMAGQTANLVLHPQWLPFWMRAESRLRITQTMMLLPLSLICGRGLCSLLVTLLQSPLNGMAALEL